jgi:hypothetical protein
VLTISQQKQQGAAEAEYTLGWFGHCSEAAAAAVTAAAADEADSFAAKSSVSKSTVSA